MSTNPEFAREQGVSDPETGRGKTKQSQGGGSEPAGGRLKEHTQELRDELNKIGQVARDATQEQWENLRERGMEKARQLEDHIMDQPLKSVAIAAAVGFVVGLMWMRR